MIKFLLGVAIGVYARDALRGLLPEFYPSSYRSRFNSAYRVVRFGCLTPELHPTGCNCGTTAN